MRPTSPVRTARGPTSTNTRAPASYIAATSSANTTGSMRCRASVAPIAPGSSGYAAPVVFENTGKAGGANAVRPSSAARRSCAAAT